MGQHKLENEFRTKLNAREIEPSAHAWDRLDAMLTVGEEKKPTPVRKLNWLYMAAGFVGIILIATLFFGQSGKTEAIKNAVVLEEKVDENLLPDKLDEKETQINPVKDILVEPVRPKQIERVAATTQKDQRSNLQSIPDSKAPTRKPEFILAANEDKIGYSINKNNQIEFTPEKNANVDELLASTREIKKEKSGKPKVTVDPGTLLSQVDGELELSFREKTLSTLGRKYKNVKVALANRNNRE